MKSKYQKLITDIHPNITIPEEVTNEDMEEITPPYLKHDFSKQKYIINIPDTEEDFVQDNNLHNPT